MTFCTFFLRYDLQFTGGGFVSLLLEKAEKRRCEKDKEKRKLMAEERKQLKEEQDKDVQEWEKNVLLKDHEEEIKSMWEVIKYIYVYAQSLISHRSQSPSSSIKDLITTPRSFKNIFFFKASSHRSLHSSMY